LENTAKLCISPTRLASPSLVNPPPLLPFPIPFLSPYPHYYSETTAHPFFPRGYVGVYLTDLTFIEDGIPSVIKRTHLINFAKRAKTAEVIRDIQQYQNVPYPLKSVADLQDYILSNMQAAGDVHEMYEKSLQVEPREREDEKITRLVELGLVG